MAGAENRLGQGRPFGQPVFQQFGERSAAGMSGSGSGERRGSDQLFSVDRPIDLVGNIRALVQQERARRSERFNPAWWLRGKLEVIAAEAFHQQQPEDKVQFFYALQTAWELVAYEKIDGEHNSSVYTDIRGYTHAYRTKTVTLSPLGVTLLDAMVEAVGIEHAPGQDTFDLSLFSSTEAMARIRRGQVPEGHMYPVPTSDEVKRAITKSAAAGK